MNTTRQNLHKRLEVAMGDILGIGKNKSKGIDLGIIARLTHCEVLALSYHLKGHTIRRMAAIIGKSKSQIARILSNAKIKTGHAPKEKQAKSGTK